MCVRVCASVCQCIQFLCTCTWIHMECQCHGVWHEYTSQIEINTHAQTQNIYIIVGGHTCMWVRGMRHIEMCIPSGTPNTNPTSHNQKPTMSQNNKAIKKWLSISTFPLSQTPVFCPALPWERHLYVQVPLPVCPDPPPSSPIRRRHCQTLVPSDKYTHVQTNIVDLLLSLDHRVLDFLGHALCGTLTRMRMPAHTHVNSWKHPRILSESLSRITLRACLGRTVAASRRAPLDLPFLQYRPEFSRFCHLSEILLPPPL